MGTRKYKESSLEKCIEVAALELNIPINEVKYTVLEEKKSIFKKSVEISVDFQDTLHCEEEILSLKEGEGTLKVVNGKLIVKNPLEGGEPAIIMPSREVRIIIDGMEITTKRQVFEHSVVEFIFNESIASRNLNITVSNDKCEAYIDINYSPQIVYGLKDAEEVHSLSIIPEILEENSPPIYTKEEIITQLNKEKIIYGIINKNLEECLSNKEINKLIVAEGVKSIDGEDDKIEFKVNTEEKNNELTPDEKGKVDFKSIGFVSGVMPEDILAIIHEGIVGQDGMDVYGNVIPHKKGIKAKISAGDGCILKGDSIIATIEGKPCVKSNVMHVYKVHNLNGDVDISTGDIRFVGDVIITGNVKEGMKVEAGNCIEIQKNIERATITALGSINIYGSAITSTITAGGNDVKSMKQIENLNNLKIQLNGLMETVEQIRKYNLLGSGVNDGETIKVLIENKFKQIPKNCIDILVNVDSDRGQDEADLIDLIKNKLIGLGPLSVKNYGEIDGILNLIEVNLNNLNASLALPVSIKVPYCQECVVKSSGDITFTGNGSYVSNIISNGNVIFESFQSVARGGEIKARNEIRCKKVGSTGGVCTKLSVEKEGHIWADVAYQNTQIVIGLRKYDIEYASKDVHAYLNEKGDIVVDSLRL